VAHRVVARAQVDRTTRAAPSAALVVKIFRIERLAQLEFDEGAAWYEQQEIGLGFEFIEEVERVLVRIETQEKFVTAPLVVLDGGAVRREFVRRFPWSRI
jgi:hypothetical protein